MKSMIRITTYITDINNNGNNNSNRKDDDDNSSITTTSNASDVIQKHPQLP